MRHALYSLHADHRRQVWLSIAMIIEHLWADIANIKRHTHTRRDYHGVRKSHSNCIQILLCLDSYQACIFAHL